MRLCGVGDHLTATFDAMLLAERGLSRSATGDRAEGELGFERELLGRFCPRHKGQLHQCRQKCELLGVGCSTAGSAEDPIEQWLGKVIHPESLDELEFDLDEKTSALARIVGNDRRLAMADLFVCSHPTLLCVVLAQVARQPVFTHASSTLLYGLKCPEAETTGGASLQVCTSSAAHTYLSRFRALLTAPASAVQGQQLIFIAEGRFLAEQVFYQVRERVPWVPPLALYVTDKWHGQGRHGQSRSAVVLRSRFFVSLMGELLRCLLREVVSLNAGMPEVTFLGTDKQFDEQWMTMEQIASYSAAVLYPNDLHQRTFHEVYRMGVPLFMPDASGLFRAQRGANWGYSSYGGVLPDQLLGPTAAASALPYAPWWNSFNATPEVVISLQQFADWEQFPHVQRFGSLPGLLSGLLAANLAEISSQMRVYHAHLEEEALKISASHLVGML